MRFGLPFAICAIGCLSLIGCSGGNDGGDEKPLQGKPEVRDAPPGKVPPGDGPRKGVPGDTKLNADGTRG